MLHAQEWQQEHAEIAAELAEHAAAARAWGCCSSGPVAAVQLCQVTARSSHGWWHGAEPGGSADQHRTEWEKAGLQAGSTRLKAKKGDCSRSERWVKKLEATVTLGTGWTTQFSFCTQFLKKYRAHQKLHSPWDVLIYMGVHWLVVWCVHHKQTKNLCLS